MKKILFGTLFAACIVLILPMVKINTNVAVFYSLIVLAVSSVIALAFTVIHSRCQEQEILRDNYSVKLTHHTCV